jgi:hypothetical protein
MGGIEVLIYFVCTTVQVQANIRTAPKVDWPLHESNVYEEPSTVDSFFVISSCSRCDLLQRSCIAGRNLTEMRAISALM